MKLVMLIDEGSVRRVRSAIERVDQASKKTQIERGTHITSQSSLDDAVQQLIASLRASFRVFARQR
jgi:hypothetical protein